jgi:predicted nucleic acid-binding protein
MREMTVREANQNFSQVIAAAERGETIIITTPPTTSATIEKASRLAHGYRIQLWDCVVCIASVEGGARALLTEDMEDGRVIDGLRLMNPFVSTNTDAIAALWVD